MGQTMLLTMHWLLWIEWALGHTAGLTAYPWIQWTYWSV
jgi:hypothetical protein